MSNWTSKQNNIKLINLCLVKILSQLSNKSIRKKLLWSQFWFIILKLNEAQFLKLTFNENLLLYLITKMRMIITSSSSFWIHSSLLNKLIVELSFNINLLIQLEYLISIFWLNLNTQFQHSDSIWYQL